MREPRPIARRIRRCLALLCGLWLVPGAADAQTGRLVEMDLRLVMAAMAQRVGANGQLGLYRAQASEAPTAIAVVGGRVDLGRLVPGDRMLRSGRLVRQPDGGLLALSPIVVWEGAELRLGPGVDLRLSRAHGAFLANFGRLDIEGARIAGTAAAPTAAAAAAFRPFVLTAGTGAVTARNAVFEELGFGGTPAQAGVAVITRGVFPAIDRSIFDGSRFEAVESLLLEATEGAVITGNEIRGARGTGIWLRQAQGGRVESNRVVGAVGHGIRLSAGSRQLRVLGNQITRASGAGIFVDSGSAGIEIRGNRIERPDGDAISLKQAQCIEIENNLAERAGGSGIRLRQSPGVELRTNTLRLGAGAGLRLQDQPAGAETRLIGNVLVGNASGLSGAGAARLTLHGNDLSRQFPRLLGGDLVVRARGLLRDLRGHEALILDPPQTTAPDSTPAAAPACQFGQGA